MVWPGPLSGRESGSGPLEVPAVPPGYELRQFRPGDEAAYNELFHLAFADEDKLEHTRATALEDGLFVIENYAPQPPANGAALVDSGAGVAAR